MFCYKLPGKNDKQQNRIHINSESRAYVLKTHLIGIHCIQTNIHTHGIDEHNNNIYILDIGFECVLILVDNFETSMYLYATFAFAKHHPPSTSTTNLSFLFRRAISIYDDNIDHLIFTLI